MSEGKNDPFWFVIQDFGVHVQSPDGKVSKVRWQGRVDGEKTNEFGRIPEAGTGL